MKKLLVIFMTAVISISFTACSKKLGVITSSALVSSETGSNTVGNVETSSQENYVNNSDIVVDLSSSYGCTHDYDSATCTMPRRCVLCGMVSGSALGHNWKSATCTTAKTCKRCAQTEGKALGHSWKEATCTEAKTCKNCGVTSGSALGHNWQEATYSSPKRCSRCNKTSGSALEAEYTGISVHTMPARTTFNVGEKFDATGLTLRKNYSDGSYEIITSGFEISGFSSSKEGTCKITVKYKNETVTFNVKIVVEDVSLMKITPFTNDEDVTKGYDIYDTYGNYYDKCFLFNASDHVIFYHNAVETYRLGGNYSRFTATVAVEEYGGDFILNIYSDDNLIYTKDDITRYTEPFNIDVDISNCNFLKIRVTTSASGEVELILANAMLRK